MNGNYYLVKPSNEDKRILLVEDDPNFGTVLKDYLVMSGFDVTLAKNGMEGFELFKKEIFDMCILDVMMPYKDGVTLAREIREKNEKIPIIFLTARTMREDVIKGYKSGGDDYLNKPFDSEILLMKIRSMLQRKNIDTMVDNNKFEFEIGNFFLNTKLRILKYKDEEPMNVFHYMSKIENNTLFFFFGILAAVGALHFAGFLNYAVSLYDKFGSTPVNIGVGFLSAVVDNVPVMSAVLKANPAMGADAGEAMSQWLLVTLTAGIGGSMISFGSAAGVGVMGKLKGIYTFGAHMKYAWMVVLGYIVSLIVWYVQFEIFHIYF